MGHFPFFTGFLSQEYPANTRIANNMGTLYWALYTLLATKEGPNLQITDGIVHVYGLQVLYL